MRRCICEGCMCDVHVRRCMFKVYASGRYISVMTWRQCMGAQNMCGAMMSILQPQPPPSPFSPPLGLLIIREHLSQLVFQGLKQDNYSCRLTDCEGNRMRMRKGEEEEGEGGSKGRCDLSGACWKMTSHPYM